jgi:ABC-type antimicrobial peptide transport system permease subunit
LGSGNVRRSPGRTSLTVAALMVGLSMVIANSSLAAAFIHDITAWVETALGGDLYVRAPLPMREQFERNLAAVPGVAGVTKIRYFAVKVAPSDIPPDVADQDTIIFAAIDPATYREVGEFEFAAGQGDPDANWGRFYQGGALFVSTVVADRYDLEQGDTLRVAALGVINTLMMNVVERRREIGGLRSLGLTRRQTVKMILAEAATLGVIGGLFGLGFGLVLSQVFVRALNDLSGYELSYVFAPGAFAAGAAIALGVSQAAALYPAWRAAGVNIVEAIKHE